MKKLLKKALALSVTMSLGLALFACAPAEKPVDNDKEKEAVSTETTKTVEKKKVTVTTSFLLDMVKVIAKDTVETTLIVPAGGDPHIYEPSAKDKEALQNADLVLYHGLHFEGKMVDILEKIGKNLSVNFPKEKIGQMEEDGEQIIDPHFWFDLDLYGLAVQEAGKQLVALNPEHKEMYEKNVEEYLAELKKLDEENKTALSSIPKESRFLITPHDAFNYFSRRYDIEVKAPQGVSTEAEASLQGVLETAKFIAEHKIKAIFAESTTNPENMKKLQEEAKALGWDVEVVSGEGHELFSDSLAPVGEFGDNFLDMYRHNVKLITEHLK